MPKTTSIITSFALFFLLLSYSNPIKAQTYCTPSTSSGTTYHITNFSTSGGARAGKNNL